jgi:hypothetical protein
LTAVKGLSDTSGLFKPDELGAVQAATSKLAIHVRFLKIRARNTANNLNNPDPTKPVYWGDQTWEEMMIGWMDFAFERKQ